MNEISKASAEAVEAARQGEQFAVLLAAVQAAAAQQQPQQHGNACGCQHHPAPAGPRRSTGQVVAIVGGVCACGVVATGMFLAIAVVAMVIGLSGVVLLFLLREYRRG